MAMEEAEEAQQGETQRGENSPGLLNYRRLKKQARVEDHQLSDDALFLSLAPGMSLMDNQEARDRALAGETLSGVAIRRLRLSGELSKQLLIRKSYIHQLELSDLRCLRAVSLSGCRFKRIHIENCTFQESLSLKSCRVETFAIIRSQLQSLNGELLKVGRKSFLFHSHFAQRVRFWEASFGDWVEWEESTFDGLLDLRSTDLAAGFSATRCHFKGDVKFRGASLRLKWEAKGSRFDKLLDFSKAKLNDFVYLEEIEQGPAQRWAFMNTVGERILVTPAQLEGRLESEESGDHKSAVIEYGVLKRSFSHEQRYDAEDWAFYRFKVNERRAKRWSWSRPLGQLKRFGEWLLLDWGCGYGTSPTKAIRTALVMILFFAGLYTLGADYLHPPERAPFLSLEVDHFVNTMTSSLLLSVSAFTSGFGDIKGAAIGWMNLLLIAEALLGTILWGLFIVAFGRKVIR